jgi:hypothetical protein
VIKRGRKSQVKQFAQEDLEVYRVHLTEASRNRDLIATCQAFRNIKDLTGWPIQKMGSELGSTAATISTHLKLLNLPEPILNSWAAGRVSATVAMAFLDVPEPLRVPLFEEMGRKGVSLHYFTGRTVRVFREAVKADTAGEENGQIKGAIEASIPLGPIAVLPTPVHSHNGNGQKHPEYSPQPDGSGLSLGYIADAAASLVRLQKLPVAEIEQDLASDIDCGRARQFLRHLIENAEISMSLLDHVERSRGTRRATSLAYQ